MNILSSIALLAALIGILPATSFSAEKAMPGTKSASSSSSSSSVATVATVAKAPAKNVSLTPTQESKLLDLLNEGSEEELVAINGVAETRAESIVNARPFGSVYELILIRGVGEATYERILQHGKSLSTSNSRTRKS